MILERNRLDLLRFDGETCPFESGVLYLSSPSNGRQDGTKMSASKRLPAKATFRWREESTERLTSELMII